MDLAFFVKVGGIIILLVLSAFFSGSEAAFFSLRRWKVERLKSTGKGGIHISELMRDPRGLLVTILMANEIVNVTASNLAAIIRREHFSHFGAAGVVIAMVTMTALIFLFGDITPKSIAVYIPERWSTLASIPMRFIYGLLAPIRKFLGKITDLFDQFLFRARSEEPKGMTLHELRSLVKESAGESGLTEEEVKIIDSISSVPKEKILIIRRHSGRYCSAQINRFSHIDSMSPRAVFFPEIYIKIRIHRISIRSARPVDYITFIRSDIRRSIIIFAVYLLQLFWFCILPVNQF